MRRLFKKRKHRANPSEAEHKVPYFQTGMIRNAGKRRETADRNNEHRKKGAPERERSEKNSCLAEAHFQALPKAGKAVLTGRALAGTRSSPRAIKMYHTVKNMV